VVAEEQPVLLEELGPEPVLVLVPERVALAVLRPRGVLRDHVERQLGDGRQALGGILLGVADRVLALKRLDLRGQGVKLVEEDRVSEEGPVVDDQRGAAHSSSADSGASRTTSTPPTSAWMRCARPASTAWSRSGCSAMSRARKPRNGISAGSSPSPGAARVSTTSPFGRMV